MIQWFPSGQHRGNFYFPSFQDDYFLTSFRIRELAEGRIPSPNCRNKGLFLFSLFFNFCSLATLFSREARSSIFFFHEIPDRKRSGLSSFHFSPSPSQSARYLLAFRFQKIMQDCSPLSVKMMENPPPPL